MLCFTGKSAHLAVWKSEKSFETEEEMYEEATKLIASKRKKGILQTRCLGKIT